MGAQRRRAEEERGGDLFDDGEETGRQRAPLRAARGGSRGAEGGGRRLHRLPALRARHPDGVRRGAGALARDARRRAAGRQEDLTGRPFVGPAGQLLDWALEEAGIDAQVYVTNAVKHFKWVPRGKRRIHSKPTAIEIGACLPWLEAELEVVQPEVIVLLGATAAQALLGANFRVTRERGKFSAPTSRLTSWRPCTPPRCCGSRTTPSARTRSGVRARAAPGRAVLADSGASEPDAGSG